MQIEISALDTLFFRDGKPFTMGEETWASSHFPPSPSVIYGVLRTAYFAENPNDLHKANEKDDPTATLIIKNICLCLHKDKQTPKLLFPIPNDLVAEKGNESESHKLAQQPLTVINNKQFDTCLQYTTDTEVASVKDGLIDDGVLEQYLNGASTNLPYKNKNKYLTNEPKVGVGLDRNTRTAAEGQLYSLNMIRPHLFRKEQSSETEYKLSLVIEFEGLKLNEKGVFRVGGEGKTGFYKTANYDLVFPTPVFADNENIVKIYLITPAVFSAGFQPEWLAKGEITHNGNIIKVERIAHSVGKPIQIGGFDMKTNKPKPMRRAVGAGAVYYIKTDNMTDFINFLNTKTALSDYKLDRQGFGTFLIAKP